jgi:hypothetical protein
MLNTPAMDGSDPLEKSVPLTTKAYPAAAAAGLQVHGSGGRDQKGGRRKCGYERLGTGEEHEAKAFDAVGAEVLIIGADRDCSASVRSWAITSTDDPSPSGTRA